MAEPLHWVMVAFVVVAGKGSHSLATPSPEPTHWFVVAVDAPGLRPTKLLVTFTLQRSVPPPPLIESLHWLTTVTGRRMFQTVVLHEAVGSPAAPWHSRTVVFDVAPLVVKVLTIVTWQIRPSPPLLSMPLAQVVVGATFVAALTEPAIEREPSNSAAAVRAIAKDRERNGRRKATPRKCRASWPIDPSHGSPSTRVCPDASQSQRDYRPLDEESYTPPTRQEEGI